MKLAPKVVWSEGMYLGPHHFQLQSRYFEDAVRFVAGSLWFTPYGITGLEFDPEALENGAAVLLQARGILPDGLPFVIPETDMPPAPRFLRDLFPPEHDAITLSLGLPSCNPRGPNCDLDHSQPGECLHSRYLADNRLIEDEHTGGDARPIQIARKNLRLLLETEPADGFTTLPVARILRNGAGQLSYDPDFIPPVLQIAASDRLMSLVRRLVEILDQKSGSIGSGRAGSGPGYSPREIADFWLRHAVNSAAAALRHSLAVKRGHPEELFLELSRLAGSLCTFTLRSHPRTLPSYDHGNPSGAFFALDRHIREHLEIIVPTNCISIPLRQAGDCFYEGDILDTRCFGRARWVLSLRAAISEAELIARTPQLVKVCSPQFVRELVKRALPGLALKHLPVPPPAISPGIEKQYFGVSRTGPCWDHMVETKRAGVYIPAEIPQPDAEILVVLE